jgi:NnrU protein
MAIFATVHSGLASLRDQGEKLIGERAFRVLFAGISLPLSVSTIVSTYYLVFSHLQHNPLLIIFCDILVV